MSHARELEHLIGFLESVRDLAPDRETRNLRVSGAGLNGNLTLETILTWEQCVSIVGSLCDTLARRIADTGTTIVNGRPVARPPTDQEGTE